MIRELNDKVLSGCFIGLCVILLLVPSTFAQFTGGGMKHFVISGNTGVGGVTLVGFKGGPINSDSSGYYSIQVPFGWTGNVTPNKEGYTFEPSNLRFDPVKANRDAQDFIATIRTFTISGSCGLQPGVVLNGFPDGPVLVSGQGRYSVEVPYGWSGSVTPVLEGFEFRPPSKPYQPVKRNMSTENYTVEKLMFSISGTLSVPGGPVAGVIMKGLPGDPITGPDGRYSVRVDYKWSGTVTPTKDGYIFDPPMKSYQDLDMDRMAEDFYGSVITYTISGNVGIPGVKLNGLPGNVISDASGQYIATVSYGLSGKITPARDGYEFSPPHIAFQRVTEDLIFQNFEAKEILVQIAGSVNLPEADKAGVQMQGLVDPNGSIVMTDARGRYQVVVPYGWFGEVSPSIEGYTFSPPSKLYENVTRDRITENYSASRIKHTISGRITPVDQNVDVANIVLEGFPTRVTTNPIGEFSTQVPFDWSNKVTPRKAGLAYNPPELEYFGVRQNMENQDFTASVKMYSISGRISSAQGPVEGVTVMTGLGSDISSVTDMDGRFELIVPHGWAGQVTFVDQGHEFNPPSKTMQPVNSDQTLNVSASMKKFKILGEIVINNEPVPGVAITATNGGGTDMTNSRGQFMVEVPYGWTGDLIPTKEGWEFDPPSKAYQSVMEDINERVGGPAMPLSSPDIPVVPTPPVEIPSPFEEPGTVDNGTDTGPTMPDPNMSGVDTAESDVDDSEMAAMRAQIKALQDRLSGQTPDTTSGTGGLIEVTPANALTPEGEGAVISSIYDGDLSIVLQDLAADAAVTIVADPEIQGQVSVDFSRGVRMEKALDTVLAGSGYDWRKTPYYYLVSSVRPEDVSFLPGSETRRVKLAYLQGSVAAALLSTSFRQYVQADPTGRVVSVTGPRSIVERIAQDLAALDIRPRQVLLDARIVTMEKGDLLNIGVEWGFPKTSVGMFSNNMKGGGDPLLDFAGASPWGIQIGYSPDATFTEALTMQLNLMVENEEAKIVANPQVMAQDSKPAEIRVVREEYYMMTDLTGLNSGLTFASRAELEKVESGTILEITPYISDANEIVLVVAAELSDSVPRGRETDLPVVTRRSTRNEVIVKDGGTVAIAGLQQHKTVDNNKAVPGISKIPLLGKLFQNDNNVGTSREIAIFVTARLIPEHTQLNRYMQQPPAAAQAPLNLSTQQPSSAYSQPSNAQMPSDDFEADLMNQLRQPSQQ